MKNFLVILTLVLCSNYLLAQSSMPQDTAKPASKKSEERKWFDKMTVRGYGQVRYNRLLESNPDLKCEQCDKSWGDNNGIFIRRARIIFAGNVGDRVSYYFQPDMASAVSSTAQNYLQMRDCYVDVAIDNQKEYRFRLGQSKVPYGWENMQSSSNRIPMDRSDGINSAISNERDLMAVFYWAPDTVRKLYAMLVNTGLKGSGDYGVVGLGAFNGPTGNRAESNNGLHYVGRFNWPFQVSGQIIEAGVYGYTGRYVIQKNSKTKGDAEFKDQRIGGSFVLYPQPFGLQAEYNIGTGPEFNPNTGRVVSRDLSGGYIMVMYRFKTGDQQIIPFSRYQKYDGGKKFEIDARSYLVDEIESGVEWQPFQGFELTTSFVYSDRTFEDYDNPDNRQWGRLLRIQAQVNF